MAIDKEASRRWRRQLRKILNEEWDPIKLCVGPDDDEYDDYVGKLAAMLRDGASDDALLAYLHSAETEDMRLPGNPERLKRVIAAIRALGFTN